MGSAVVTQQGNVATELKASLENAGRERVSFRVMSTERRLDAGGNWVDGDTFAVSVVCWGALARNVAQSLKLGDPVVVTGRMSSRRFEAEGETKYVTELRAAHVGHDLSRGVSSFTKAAWGTASAPASEEPAVADLPDDGLAAAS